MFLGVSSVVTMTARCEKGSYPDGVRMNKQTQTFRY